ncbi:Serine/threonine protein kinase [Amycolatopsis marina]|uniref:Serine/threonine protein kinase n=1 Tax=Amycolatopsis marina TaxID=490629 RepID=A0A1I0VJL4_9PSEU|nr:Serine/threonine protein kinase [Amycolatopsis marina]
MKPLTPSEHGFTGRYRLLAALGEGGMGRVLLAAAPDGRLVAVKHVHPGFAQDASFRTRFRHEVAASRLVSGAYTAAVMDADPDAPVPWLASVFVAGPSLREAVDATGALPVTALRLLAAGLASALADIHRAGLIHRDLKPSNVLLAVDGPRVIDFGIARAADGSSDLTGTGSLIGSPGFMSPEQARSETLTPASDVFSLGVLLVMACTGKDPFTGASAPQTLYNVVHASPDLAEIPDSIRPLVEACLAKEPAHRPTPAQILDFVGPLGPGTVSWPPAVRQLIERQQAEVHATLALPPSAPAPRHRGRGKRALVAAAALAVVAMTAGTVTAVTLNSGDGDQQSATPERGALGGDRSETTVPEPLGLEPLSLERLLAVDPCQLLADVPIPGVGKLEPETESYNLNECKYESEDVGRLTVEIGERMPNTNVRAADQDAEGHPVIIGQNVQKCDAAVQIPDEEIGVVVTTSVARNDSCDDVEAALRVVVNRLYAGPPEFDRPSESLIGVDACALMEEKEARKVFGVVTRTERTKLRECTLEVGGKFRIALDQGIAPEAVPDGREKVDLAGKTGFLKPGDEDGGSYCALEWSHRPVGERRSETVYIFHTSSTETKRVDELCGQTQEAAKLVVEALPKT